MKRAGGFGVGEREHATAVAANIHEADVLEDAQMFRDRGLLHAQAVYDISHGALLKGEKVQDVAAAGFGDGVEGVGGGGSARHGQRIHAHMGICQEETSRSE
jgi:hypothetical protein